MKREDSPPSSILTLPVEPVTFPPPPPPAPIAPEAELALGAIDPLIDQVDNLHAFARTGLVGNTVGAVVVVALYAQAVPLLTMVARAEPVATTKVPPLSTMAPDRVPPET